MQGLWGAEIEVRDAMASTSLKVCEMGINGKNGCNKKLSRGCVGFSVVA